MERRPGRRPPRSVASIVGCSSSGGSAHGAAGGATDTITLYSGQHEETTQALVDAFTKPDRHQGEDPQRRRGHPGPADRAGGLAIARRRLLHRELPAPDGARAEGDCWPRPTGRRWPRSTPGTARRPAGGWASRPASSCLVYDTKALERRARCRPRCSTWPTRSGRASWPWPPARPTSSRSSRRSSRRRARPPPSSGSKRSRPTRRATPIPTTRRSSARSTRGKVAARHHQPLLLVPPRRRERAPRACTRPLSYFAPHDPGLRARRVRRRRAGLEPAPGGGPEVRGLPRQPRPVRTSSPTRTASSTRSVRGWPPTRR